VLCWPYRKSIGVVEEREVGEIYSEANVKVEERRKFDEVDVRVRKSSSSEMYASGLTSGEVKRN